MNNVLNQMLEKYDIKSIQDKTNAIKEIIQEIVLCGLSRSNFFDDVYLITILTVPVQEMMIHLSLELFILSYLHT